MKLLRTALLAAGLVALSACGGAEEANVADNLSDDTLNVPDDSLTADENLLGNETLNDTGLDNGSVTNTGADNAATENAAGNAQ